MQTIASCMEPVRPMNIVKQPGHGIDDSYWTPSQWSENSTNSPTECVILASDILDMSNNAFARLSVETEVGKIAALERRLDAKWEKASKKDQNACIQRGTEACRIVCKVIAPKDGEKIFKAMKNVDEANISEQFSC